MTSTDRRPVCCMRADDFTWCGNGWREDGRKFVRRLRELLALPSERRCQPCLRMLRAAERAGCKAPAFRTEPIKPREPLTDRPGCGRFYQNGDVNGTLKEETE